MKIENAGRNLRLFSDLVQPVTERAIRVLVRHWEAAMKAPNKLPLGWAVIAALLLGSCDGHTLGDTYNLADVANANARNALAAAERLGARADELEQKLQRLEREMQDRERMEDAISIDLRNFMDQYNRHTH
jgi:hypothetical protein